MAALAARVYADATALIRLARIDLLDLMPLPVRVTGHVWQEVAGDSARPGATALYAARDRGLLLLADEQAD